MHSYSACVSMSNLLNKILCTGIRSRTQSALLYILQRDIAPLAHAAEYAISKSVQIRRRVAFLETMFVRWIVKEE